MPKTKKPKKPVYHTGCTILRVIHKKHYTMKLGGDASDMELVSEETVTEACNVPLFGEEEKIRGVCRGCRKGWEVEGSLFATEAEKQRAMSS